MVIPTSVTGNCWSDISSNDFAFVSGFLECTWDSSAFCVSLWSVSFYCWGVFHWRRYQFFLSIPKLKDILLFLVFGMNKVSVNICVQFLYEYGLSFHLGKYFQVGLFDCILSVWLTLWLTARLFSKKAVHFAFQPTRQESSCLSTYSEADIVIFWCFDFFSRNFFTF